MSDYREVNINKSYFLLYKVVKSMKTVPYMIYSFFYFITL